MVNLKRLKHMSLSIKLKLYFAAILLPLAALVIFLLISMVEYSKKYNRIISNVTSASGFNFNFKQTLDYKMYQYVASGKDLDEFRPFSDIDEALQLVNTLKLTTTKSESLALIWDMSQFLNNLRVSAEDIYKTTGYDKRISMLENNVYILTELIKDRMSEYVYLETRHLADLQKLTQSEILHAIQIIIMTSVALICVLWLVTVGMANSITRPLQQLCESTKKIGSGDFTIRQIESSNNEIQKLGDSFDLMAERIHTLLNDAKQEQINLRKTELKLLQAQITPHFLYNTLDTIIWLSEDGKNSQVVDVVTSLSNFFRTTLSSGRDFISIHEEMVHIRSYLEIQQVRYRDILDYRIIIPEEIYDYLILKLTLQPIVENALYHGVKNKRGKGNITITGTLKNGNIYLETTDNGRGMSTEEMNDLMECICEPLNRCESFGLKNVNERIALNYGKEYGLYIESTLGVGTKVTVIIPAQKNIQKS